MRTKAFFIIVCIIVLGYAPIFAQNPGNEHTQNRANYAVQKIDATLNLDRSKRGTIKNIFANFYTNQDRLREQIQRPATDPNKNRGFKRQDFQTIRKQNEALINERDNRLQKELTTQQFRKWKGNIEPTLRNNNSRRRR